MNGPLLIDLLPSERVWDPAAAYPDSASIIMVFLLAGFLLTFFLRDKER